jgi:hypothetical protein
MYIDLGIGLELLLEIELGIGLINRIRTIRRNKLRGTTISAAPGEIYFS